jgi:hypothetical protein
MISSALGQRCADLNVLCIEDPLPKARLVQEAAGGSRHADRPALKFDARSYQGLGSRRGSGVYLGILGLSYIHATAVVEGATIPHDILSTPLHLDDFVVRMP